MNHSNQSQCRILEVIEEEKEENLWLIAPFLRNAGGEKNNAQKNESTTEKINPLDIFKISKVGI